MYLHCFHFHVGPGGERLHCSHNTSIAASCPTCEDVVCFYDDDCNVLF